MNQGGYPEYDLATAPGFHMAGLRWLPDDPYQPEEGTCRYYATKARVAATLKPTRVCEIGVRAGYSALAFHMGHPYTEFYGLDQDEGMWGGQRGYLNYAAERLADLPNVVAHLERGDSQTRQRLPDVGQRADLFHVDGDHTPKGAAHDIILATVNRARWILVDDYDSTHHVADGADWAIKALGLTAWYVPDGGYRGNVLIRGRER